MTALMLLAVAVAVPPAPPTSTNAKKTMPPESPGVLTYALNGLEGVFDVPVSERVSTVVKFPVDCFKAIPADNFIVTASIDNANRRLVVITAQEDTHLGQVVNVAVTCVDQITISLNCIVSPDSKVRQVRIERSGELLAAIDAAMDEARDELTKEVRVWVQDEFLQGLLTTFVANDDVEETSKRLVYVRAYQQVRAGGQGFILFSVKNRSDNAFEIGGIEVRHKDQPMNDQRYRLSTTKVTPGTVENGVIAFTYDPPDADEFTLVVNGTNRTLEVTDIDFH